MYNAGVGWQEHVSKVRSIVEGAEAEYIIEIGAGDCEFLASLRTDAVRVAIDPCEAVERAQELGLLYIRQYFQPDLHMPTGSKTTVVVMRHLLEHMKLPRDFLEGIVGRARELSYACDSLTCLLIEVPCCEKALLNGRIEDWTYEHPQNFTLTSLQALLRNCGLNHFSVLKSYNDEVLVAQAFIAPSNRPHSVPGIIDRFSKIDAGVLRAREYIRQNEDKIAFWGGAGKSAMFLRKMGVEENDIVVDSHQTKWGLYVPGTKTRIRAPGVLRFISRPTIIATTSWRAEDIREDIKKQNVPCDRLLKFEGGNFVEVPRG